MKFKTFTLFLLLIGYNSIQAQDDCCNTISDAFAGYCIAGVDGCVDGGANCNIALFVATFPGVSFPFTTQCSPSTTCTPAGCTGGFVPVDLSSFDLSIQKESIALKWTTLSELDNKGFSLEHSKDGKNWNELIFVGGNGTTVEPKTYNYSHITPHLGLNYYRLEQIDFDGSSEFSNTIVAVWRGGLEADIKLVVIPNPTSEWILPVLPPALKGLEEVVFEIFDMAGRTVYASSHYLSDKGIRINVMDFQAGSYIIRAKGEHTVYNTTFIKAN